MQTGGLARRVTRWTIIAFLIFGLIIFAVEWVFKQQVTAINTGINNHLNQQNRLQTIEESYRSAVSNFRAYLAFDAANFRVQADADRDRFLQELEQYRLDSANRTDNKDAITELDEQSRAYFSYFPLIEGYKKQGQQAEIERTSRTITTPLVRSVNAGLDELISKERAEVNRLMTQSQQLNSIVLFIPIVFIMLGLIAALLLVRYLRKSMIEPVTRLESAVRRISNGEYLQVEQSRSADEISSLINGINHMSDQLCERDQQHEHSLQQLEQQNDEMEAQNEEILAQQHEQAVILEKLTERETQLQLINSYQEKLTGFSSMGDFLEHSLRALMQATHHDAVMLVVRDQSESARPFRMVYAVGWPQHDTERRVEQLYGPALEVIEERRPVVRSRSLSGEEVGLHQGYERADDHYYPLFDEHMQAIGYLLFTTYGSLAVNIKDRMLTEGLINQFGLAYQAQLAGEARRKQSIRLEELNAELETEKLMIKQQRDTVQEIIDSLHEGLVLCDHNGIISFCNAQVSAVLPDLKTGASIDSLNAFLDQQHMGSYKLSEQVLHAIKQHLNNWKTQFSLRARDGSIHHMEMYINVITGADLQQYHLLVLRDRTEEEQANQLKNEFVSIVSHELRTPLASILGFVEILLNREVKPEKAKRYMETIHREANRLSNLINDFLDLQRMESGKQTYTLVPFDLRTIIGDVAVQWDGKQEHHVYTELPERTALVRADQDRITQVMHNLISNAIKYSPGKERVDVRLREQGNHWLIEVQDYGLGIPDEAKDKMFSKFYRVDNSDRRQIGGTGLGLAIVREILNDLGGEITFESTLGAGSIFTVRLPKLNVPVLDNHIVVIEDEENLSRLIAATFEEQQYEILTLNNAEEALLGLQQVKRPPLLCIVDIHLQGPQSGWDFITALKSNALTRDVPVIVSSALDQPQDFAEKVDEKYLQKPFTVERLLELGVSLMGEETPTMRTDMILPSGDQDAQLVQQVLQRSGLGAAELKLVDDVIKVDLLGDSFNDKR
ncbi:ATP-binding protein [Paenibacillus sp. SGZ-1009]|uniref:ATP-binding protein n=1 Tax=Paenibacillus campi TaxID=3106031 RepID=UPI002AFF232C|nr:ATP-binding protein [Paenibacillus sp. SGZ-1009]